MPKKIEKSVKVCKAEALEEIKTYDWDQFVDVYSIQSRMESILVHHKVQESWVRSTFKHLAEYNGWELPKKPRKRVPQGWRLELVKCALDGLEDIDKVIARVSDHVKTPEKAAEYVKEFYMYFQVAVKGI